MYSSLENNNLAVHRRSEQPITPPVVMFSEVRRYAVQSVLRSNDRPDACKCIPVRSLPREVRNEYVATFDNLSRAIRSCSISVITLPRSCNSCSTWED